MYPASTSDANGYKVISVSRAVTPNYHWVIESGQWLNPLPYSLSLDVGDKKKVSVFAENADGSSRQLSTWGTFSISKWFNPLTDSEVSLAKTQFDNKMLLKLKGQSLPILMALKERKATATLIMTFLNKSYKAALAIRHPFKFFKAFRGRMPRSAEKRRLLRLRRLLLRRKRRFGRDAVTISEAFIQYRFAWRPLLADISDMLDGAKKAMEKSIARYAMKGFQRSFEITKKLPTYFAGGQPGGVAKASVSIQGHQKIYYAIDDATLALYSQSQSFLATVWDGVPYSFIVDGLVNVSKYLECSNATLGLKFLSGYKSIMAKASSYLSPTPFKNGGQTCFFDQLPSKRAQISFNRQILTGFPVPKLEFPYEDYLTALHCADIAALIIQRLKQKF